MCCSKPSLCVSDKGKLKGMSSLRIFFIHQPNFTNLFMFFFTNIFHYVSKHKYRNVKRLNKKVLFCMNFTTQHQKSCHMIYKSHSGVRLPGYLIKIWVTASLL